MFTKSSHLYEDTTEALLFGKEQELIQSKIKFEEALQNDKIHLNSLPDVNSIKQEADTLKRLLLERFSGKEHLSKMIF